MGALAERNRPLRSVALDRQRGVIFAPFDAHSFRAHLMGTVGIYAGRDEELFAEPDHMLRRAHTRLRLAWRRRFAELGELRTYHRLLREHGGDKVGVQAIYSGSPLPSSK